MGQSFEKTIQSKTMNLDLTDAGPGKISLNTLCTDLFLIIFNMVPQQDMGSEQDMRRILRHFIDRFDGNCKVIGVETEKKDFAKYALVALIDEKVLALPQKWSGPWRSHPLQFDYFGDMVAGKRFFEHLDRMLQDPEEYVDVMEIFYLCLCLGFKGKYGDDKPAIEDLIKNIARAIIKHRPSISTPTPPSRIANKKRRTVPIVPSWMVAAVSASIAVLLWLGAWITVSNQSTSLLPNPHVENASIK